MNNKKVIIASCHETVRQLLQKGLNDFCRIGDAEMCCNEYELYEVLGAYDETLIFVDKYFFGYVMDHKIRELKFRHKERTLCFCETEECSVNFGIRVHELGADGFIAHIENSEHIRDELRNALAGKCTFPKEVSSRLKNKNCLDRKYFSDVTKREEEIGCLLGVGFSQKQIKYELGLSEKTVSTHVCYLNQKIGHKDDMDYIILNNQSFSHRKQIFGRTI